ncbi:MAG: c-type cytochrome [Gammaproteobacteria bacterium]|nr:c-type cytochrome [Gammaproteobacteria bacterium]
MVGGVTQAASGPSEDDVKTFLRPMEVPQPADNLSTSERVELGKALFFDPRLSGSGWISCATCHNPVLGWSDGLPTAIGHGMKVLGRSTPTILNGAYQKFQFWDGRAATLEQQALGPIQAEPEMAGNMGNVIRDLSAIPKYKQMFEVAYPGKGINNDTIAKAIAAFERSVVSTDSPFDLWLKGQNTMAEAALRGFEIFKGKANCAACHSGYNFSDSGFHNIGLPDNTDEGRFKIKAIKVMKGSFKTPTLRDVALTAPYMHNGQYKSLEEVVDHYNSGGTPTFDNLDPNMKKLNLSKQEKKDLVEFLKSLTGAPLAITYPQLPVK